MFVSKLNRTLIAVLFLLFSSVAYSGIPLAIPYAGTIKVDGERFNGEGLFKFAIVNADCGFEGDRCRTIWSNDRTSTKGSEPSSAVTSVVNDGNYKILLGDIALANMVELSKASFDTDNVFLRIWFDDGINGSQLLTPDQPFTSSAYAYHAGIADTVSAGAIGVNEIDSTQVQRRGVDTQCSAGEVVSGIGESGDVQCIQSLATNSFVAGDGISFIDQGEGIVISAAVSNTIIGTCENGAISSIDDNGNISCSTNVSLSAGEGISITEGVISASGGFSNEKVVSAVNAADNINAHHPRYTDEDAVKAISSITDLHDKFTGAEAVAAVNAAGSQIAAHHPRYSDAEVITAINANSASVNAHHNRYTDQEAIAAIEGAENVDASSLGGVSLADIARTDSSENFANGTLYIDADNSRIGIGSTEPTEAMDVEGNVVAQSFMLKQARTRYLNIPANTFPNIRKENGWELNDGFIFPYIKNTSIYAYVPINLASGVEVTQVSCDFDIAFEDNFDPAVSFISSIGVQLRRYEKGTANQLTLISDFKTDPPSNVGVQVVSGDLRDEVSGVGLLLDNSSYRYALKIDLNSRYIEDDYRPDLYGSYVRIYGCDIEYLEQSL